MKKNTLLYLDSHLVALAKKNGLNLSKLMEDTLNGILADRRAFGELSFWEYLTKMKDMDLCEMFFLPFQVNHLKLENIGVFDSFEAGFNRDEVNLICGRNATGKSTILRSIAYWFGIESWYFRKPSILGKNWRITIEIYPHSNLTTAELKEDTIKTRFNNAGCILLDDPFQMLNSKKVKTFLRQLAKLRKQIIITTIWEKTAEDLQNKNIIRLKTEPPNIS